MTSTLWTRLGACLLMVALASCGARGDGGARPNGKLNIIPDRVQLRSGASKDVAFELAESQALVNQVVNFRVSDPDLAHVTPSSCVVSSGPGKSAACTVTVTGKKKGALRIFAEADGFERDSAPVTVSDENPYGTLSVTPSSATSVSYYTKGRQIPFHFTVQLTPTAGGKSIPRENPLAVFMNQPAGNPFTFVAQQCVVWTTSASCSIAGTLDATKVAATGFASTISVVGAWQAAPLAAFNQDDDITITWTGSAAQQPGDITISSQNQSNQVYTGMKAPMFVELAGNTLDTASYQVTVTSNDPSRLVFYQFPDGVNDLGKIDQYSTNAVTCNLSLDNTSALAKQNSTTSCGYGLYPKASGAAALTVTVSGTSTPAAATPDYSTTVNFLIVDAGQLSNGRTITLINDASEMIVFNANSGTSTAYASSVSMATGAAPANPAQSTPGAQAQCGPSNPRNACPIGSTCVQGGRAVKPRAGIPFYCYWDAPTFVSASHTTPANHMPPNSTASLFIPGWSGVTTGAQQVQWSGNYYVQKCENGVCPASPPTLGTGSTYPAETLVEVTYQHNTSDFYDVSIINGVNYGMRFGPAGTTPDASNAYLCGTAGSMSPMSGTPAANPGGYLPASTWHFAPDASNFPASLPGTDSPSSYYAVVEPAPTSAVATSCSQQSDCQQPGTSGPQCGWNYAKVGTGTFTFGSADRICGTFNSWATANQVWGWNMTETNAAPFNLRTSFAVSPSFNGQTTVSGGDLQLCINNTYSAYTTPQPVNAPDGTGNMSNALACGGTDWTGITRPSAKVTTANPNWISNVLPTIGWLKAACPTCYTFPYDDPSSTFTCGNSIGNNGSNTLNYTLTIHNITNTFK